MFWIEKIANLVRTRTKKNNNNNDINGNNNHHKIFSFK